MCDLDLDSLRHSYESDTEWQLRRRFLEVHSDKFDHRRLICLASCFVNVECYGCEYPAPLMVQLVELMADIKDDVDVFRKKVKDSRVNPVKFVKAESDLNTSPNVASKSDKATPLKPVHFVNSRSGISSTETLNASSNSRYQSNFESEPRMPGNRLGLGFGQATSTSNSDYQTDFESESQMPGQGLGFGHASDSVQPMHTSRGGQNPRGNYRHSNLAGASNFSQSRGYQPHGNQPRGRGSYGMGKRGGQGRGGKRKFDDLGTVSLEDILILEHSEQQPPAHSVLHHTEGFNKITFDYDFREEELQGEHRVTCNICYGLELLGSATASNKATAKAEAGEKALEYLRSRCYTIVIKQSVDSSGPEVSRDQLMGEIVSSIPSSNIGSKLLQKMGWSGGGVGKQGQGIAEPVSMETVINREGLGLQAEKGISKNFLTTIQPIIHKYARSEDQKDLAFAEDFSKEERAIIHREAQKIGLKSQSHGKGDNRYLVLSRKRTVRQLYQHVSSMGGETEKYRLVPPQGR